MNQLIDLCGTPIRLEKIKDFRLVKRECLFYPAYQEMEEQTFSLFARFGAEKKKKFKFVKMAPFGMLLNDKEKPQNGGYEIKSFGEAAALNVLSGVGKAVGNMANLAADMLRIDTSGNKEFRIRMQGGRLTNIKLRDVPAKVMFLSGKVSDVYKNDPIYEFLGEPIAPTIAVVPTLVVTVEKATHVFLGGGVDLDDAEAAYHQLFEMYKQFQEESEKKKAVATLPRINLSLPKLNMPSIKIQSPFVVSKKGTNDEAVALPESVEIDSKKD